MSGNKEGFQNQKFDGVIFETEFIVEPYDMDHMVHIRVNFDKTDSQLKIFLQIMCQQLFQKWLEQTIKDILSWFSTDFHSRVLDRPQQVYGPSDPGWTV